MAGDKHEGKKHSQGDSLGEDLVSFAHFDSLVGNPSTTDDIFAEPEWQEPYKDFWYDFENDHQRFTEGACHRLAMAINDITGWPIYAFWCDDDYDTHAFVKTPWNTYVDIEGERDYIQMCRRWIWAGVREVTQDDLDRVLEGWDGGWFDVELAVKRAEALAPGIVEEVSKCKVMQSAATR